VSSGQHTAITFPPFSVKQIADCQLPDEKTVSGVTRKGGVKPPHPKELPIGDCQLPIEEQEPP